MMGENMKNKLCFFVIIVFVLIQILTVFAKGIIYEFSSFIINYAVSFTLEDFEYNHGWLGEIIGNDNLLTVRYAEIEFVNEKDEVVNSESLIVLKGTEGEYNFLSNSMTVGGGNGYNGNGVRIQFWAFKVLDGTSVVKSGNENDKMKAVYLSFEDYQEGMPTKLMISFNEPNMSDFTALDEYPSKAIDFRKLNFVGKPVAIVSFDINDAIAYENIFDEVIENNIPIVDDDKKQDSADILYQLELFKGTEAGYELGSELTRAQAATLIVRLMGKETEADSNSYISIFTDVPEDHWAKNYIMYCYENNITYGTSNDTYSPELLIPYDQFQALVLRTLGYSANPETAIEVAVDS
jgi:hypothetical protein